MARSWARRAIDALAGAGFVVLGTDLRKYDAEGGVSEAPWSDVGSAALVDVETGRQAASEALSRADQGGLDDYDWVVITWR